MHWEVVTFGRREICETPHKWSNRALAIALQDGDVVIAECCTRCGTLRAARKSGTGARGNGRGAGT